MAKKNDEQVKAPPIELGDPIKEVVDFMAGYFGKVKGEGRDVPGLDRIMALKESMDKSS